MPSSLSALTRAGETVAQRDRFAAREITSVMTGLSVAQAWNVTGLVLSLIGILLLFCVWRVVSHAKRHLRENVDEVGLRLDRIYGVLGWIGLAFVVAGTIVQIVRNVL
jgi:hypothetical protein